MDAPVKPPRDPALLLVARTGWGQQVSGAAMRIRGRMSGLGHENGRGRATRELVVDQLELADAAVIEKPGWHRLSEWWSGRRIETAWAHIREAELLLVTCGAGDGRFQRSNVQHAQVDAAALPQDDPARVAFEKPPTLPPYDDLVPTIQAVLEASFRQRNAYHGAARALRNRLVVVTLLVLVIAAGLVVTQLFIPQAPVLPSPKGDGSARWVTMLLVMFFGALGALITAIPVMASLPRVSSPYNFPLQQSFMKIAVGTLTGVVGVVVIGLPATTGSGDPTFGALVGAAIVFGAGQQVVTRFLDTRAQQVVDAMPRLDKARPVEQ